MFRAKEAQLFLEALKTPERTQEATLLEKMIRPNVDCELGKKFGFGSIATVADYQARVPISTYEDLRPLIDRVAHGEEKVLYTEPTRRFFMTSGSTAKAKYVPVTSSFVRDKSRAFGIYWSLVFEQHPEVKADEIVTNFSDSGEMKTAPCGLPASSESAYWSHVTAATQRRSQPIIPKSVQQIADPEERYHAIARILMTEKFSALMALNPSTIYLLFKKMNDHARELIADIAKSGNTARAAELESIFGKSELNLPAHAVWPALKMVISWRSPMLEPYLRLLEPHLQGVTGRDYISTASEGIISIPVKDGGSGGVIANGVHFYELIPEEHVESPRPDVLLPHQAELGKNYVVLLTTTAGLYRYNIGDVVRVNGFVERTPQIEFLYRAGNTCSLTGEKLTEEQVTDAVVGVAKELRLDVESFTAQPSASGFPRYLFLVELRSPAPDEVLARFPRAIDRALETRNIEYGSKRESERLGAPELWLLKVGSYRARRQRRIDDGANDAQLKPVHLTRDARFVDQFEIERRISHS